MCSVHLAVAKGITYRDGKREIEISSDLNLQFISKYFHSSFKLQFIFYYEVVKKIPKTNNYLHWEVNRKFHEDNDLNEHTEFYGGGVQSPVMQCKTALPQYLLSCWRPLPCEVLKASTCSALRARKPWNWRHYLMKLNPEMLSYSVKGSSLLIFLLLYSKYLFWESLHLYISSCFFPSCNCTLYPDNFIIMFCITVTLNSIHCTLKTDGAVSRNKPQIIEMSMSLENRMV